ncbi:MAG: bifunctional precorrin-2 dehydrogenase/sirohydrochlorin ferrochelatase [Lachnospiraceae bacterium]|nr:bifunctional precorrin-2 dehydrogenase/sirohydrochlorin ferrochelatase [Lachnospiraceae bacterium]
MAAFPLFVELEQYPCLVVGAGLVASRKIHTLLSYGARVTVTAPRVCDEVKRLAERNRIILHRRSFEPDDLTGKGLVFVATDDEAVSHEVAALCRQRHIFVNVADVKPECDFYFPALVRRGDVVVGISTGGKSPALAKELRKEIDRRLPEELADFVKEAGALRSLLLESGRSVEDNPEYRQMVQEFVNDMAEKRNP